MLHGGSLWCSPPVRMLLMHLNASPQKGGSYPREPPFFILRLSRKLKSVTLALNITRFAEL